MIENNYKIIFLFLLFSIEGHTQQNVFKTDILGLMNKRINIACEHTFKSKFSIVLAYENQRYNHGEVNGQMTYEVRGKGIVPELRFYPFNSKKPSPLVFFVGSSFRYIIVNDIIESFAKQSVSPDGRVFNYTFISGYKFNKDRVILEILGGYGGGTHRI